MKYSVLTIIERVRDSAELQKEVEEQLRKERKTKSEKAESEKAESKKKNKKRTYEANTEAEIKDKLTYKKVVTEIQQTIGGRLQRVRIRNKLGQPEIMDRYNTKSGFNLDKSCLSRWESGTRAIDLIFLLWCADEFDVDLHWLLTGEKRMSENETVEELQKAIKTVYELSQKLQVEVSKMASTLARCLMKLR